MKRNTRYLATLIIGLAFMLLSISEVTAQNTSPLCFTARNGNITVIFTIRNVTHTIQYSTNGTSWSTYTSGTGITINADSSVYFRAETDQTIATAFGAFTDTASSQFSFSSSNGGTVEASGNVMSLYGPSCPNLPLYSYAFSYLLYNCSLLTTPPDLPAVTLSDYCYLRMFDRCSALTSAPDLPATTLSPYCYLGMFLHCSSLTSVPDTLPATTLTRDCYSSMFSYCSSLTTAPALPATTLANDCYDAMFFSCTALTTAPTLPATTMEYGCYDAMFANCTALTTAPALPATTLASSCYSLMFSSCSALTTAPALPATTLASSCYYCMFERCTALTTAPALPADTCLYWRSYYRMFQGCTSLTTIPDITAIRIESMCCEKMFDGCTSLIINTNGPGKSWKITSTYYYTNSLTDMFTGTSSTMNGTPSIDTTYYIASDPSVILNLSTSCDTTMGSVTNGGTYKYRESVTLTATPKHCHRFVNWSNGATTSTTNVIVVSDTVFTANFAPLPPDSTALYENVCHGSLFSGYGIQDILINQDTTITITSKTTDNCDSITCIHISCLPTTKSYDYVVITEGESYSYRGKTYSKAGDYCDTLIATNGCDSIVTLHLDVVGGTDVEDADGFVVSIIPNPVHIGETATIYGDFGDVTSVEIINNFGQVVTTFRPAGYPITIPAISTPGIYHLRIITTDGRRYLTKLVVI